MHRELTFDATQFCNQSLRKQPRPVTAISSVPPTIQSAQDRCGPVPTSIFILSTFFQRLGIWVSGFPFPLVLFLSPFMLAYGFWQGRVKLSHARLLLFVFFAGSVVISSVWGPHTKPTASLLFLVVYSVWLFYMPATHKEYTDYIHKIALLVSVLCIIGMFQFLIQFAVKSDYLFSWNGVIPSQLLIEHNTLRESSYNSGIYNGNGFFLLEASTLSALAARMLLLVVLILKDVRYILPLALGLAFAMSGTGMIFAILFTALPLAGLVLKNRKVTGAEIGLVFTAAVAFGAVFLFYSDYFLERLGEFSDPYSSGHARFTSTLIVFNEHVAPSLGTFLLGYGPGSFSKIVENASVEYHSTGWIKLFVELGLLGTVSFCAFFMYCVYSSTKSFYIAFAMLFQYIMLDSGVLSPQFTFLAFAMCVFAVPCREAAVADEREGRSARCIAPFDLQCGGRTHENPPALQ